MADESSFIARVHRIMEELYAQRFPNKVSLAKMLGCSRSTMERDLTKLEHEYSVPIGYDASRKGYFLKDPSYRLTAPLPAGRDELAALLLLRSFAKDLVQAGDLCRDLDTLWGIFASQHRQITQELRALTNYFSCNLTSVGLLADQGVLQYVTAAAAGESVEIVYKSPWRHQIAKTYRGRILKVHYSDGHLYLLVAEETGREIVLNASFVKTFKVLDFTVPIQQGIKGQKGAENWLDGFGIWSGETMDTIEIHILPPASEYFASQIWHVDQEDTWKEGILMRTVPAVVSPEIVRRVLSLGKYVSVVKPESLRLAVVQDAQALVNALEADEMTDG
jgi:hypothetical protein